MSTRFIVAGLALSGFAACGGSAETSNLNAFPDASVDASLDATRGKHDAPMKLNVGDANMGGVCKSKTCADLGASCGPQGDGCGNVIQCGDCHGTETCGGGGTANVCGTPSATGPDGGAPCVPATCTTAHATCGVVGDGCGNVLQCGTCASPFSCGGGGVPYVCGTGGADGGGCLAPLQSCGTASGSTCVNLRPTRPTAERAARSAARGSAASPGHAHRCARGWSRATPRRGRSASGTTAPTPVTSC